MVDSDGLLSVGHIRKAHGLKGEVVVRLTTNRSERVAKGARLTADGRELIVATSRPKDSDFLVRFDGVADRNAAEELRGIELLAEPIEDQDELWVHELIGATVFDQHGTQRGTVAEVQANPASDLLVLDSEMLIPTVFVTEFTDGVVMVEAPEGLFDL